jgi:Pyruvate/2-oxoacid:ferredoxin oxidoreductase gamma subunit
VVVLAVGGGPGAVLAASALGTAAVALGARMTASAVPGAHSGSANVVAVLRASQVQLALIGMSALDLVLAKALLDEEQAGLYALGAVATKAAFWESALCSFWGRWRRRRCSR